MAVTPCAALRTSIPHCQWQLGIRWWLGLPLTDEPNLTCPHCHLPSDRWGDHAVCCKRNSFYGRHLAVQSFLADTLQEGHMPFQREVELTTHNATCRNGRKLRPADLLLPNFDAGKV